MQINKYYYRLNKTPVLKKGRDDRGTTFVDRTGNLRNPLNTNQPDGDWFPG
jgi:hypothetical protein